MRTSPAFSRFPAFLVTCGLLLAVLATLPARAAAAENYVLRDYGTKCVSGQTDELQNTYQRIDPA